MGDDHTSERTAAEADADPPAPAQPPDEKNEHEESGDEEPYEEQQPVVGTAAGVSAAVTAPDGEPPMPVDAATAERSPEPALATEGIASQATDAPPLARRRPRTLMRSLVAVIAGAAVGCGVGYGVQDRRPPTPQPKLAQPQPAQPRLAAGISFAPLPASQDEQVAFADDLASFLLPKPAGATDITDQDGGTMPDFVDYAEAEYEHPQDGFVNLNDAGVVSIAQRVWQQSGDIQVWDMLFRYTEQASGTSEARSSGTNDATDMGPSGSEPTVTQEPGWGFGEMAVYAPAHHGDDYQGLATTSHGDVVMVIRVDSPHPVSSSFLANLGTRQWDRL